jgi:membrane protein implicated in regulation of membrane protease activity
MTYFFWTYLARFLGLLLLVPALFPSLFINWFPGLQDRRAAMVLFAAGIAVYAVASIVFYILKKKERDRRNAEMEELR